jgi:hypothetical protein
VGGDELSKPPLSSVQSTVTGTGMSVKHGVQFEGAVTGVMKAGSYPKRSLASVVSSKPDSVARISISTIV